MTEKRAPPSLLCRCVEVGIWLLTPEEAQKITDVLESVAERAFERERPFWAEVEERREEERQRYEASLKEQPDRENEEWLELP